MNYLKELLKVGVYCYYLKEYLDMIINDIIAKSLLSYVYYTVYLEAIQGALPSEDVL
jgi:hypothetical protein